MISRMMRLVNKTDSLHLTPPEQKEVLDYAKSLPNRFKAARAVEELEADIARRAVSEWEAAHPELGATADFGWPEAVGDVRVVLRAAALAALLDDDEYTDARAAATLRRTLGFLDVPAGAVNDLFATLAEVAKETLPPAAADVLAPYLAKLAAKQPAAV